jgi:predicted Fe-S protein YdhL (DUF1289 family)
MSATSSPCVKLCILDAAGICEGCGRSIAEIGAWSGATEAERAAVVVRAAARRAAKP